MSRKMHTEHYCLCFLLCDELNVIADNACDLAAGGRVSEQAATLEAGGRQS